MCKINSEGLDKQPLAFNRIIFCPAKHEATESEEEHKYSQANAICNNLHFNKVSQTAL
jgi:hypothetical protein